MVVEDPLDCIVEVGEGPPGAVAALKRWVDDAGHRRLPPPTRLQVPLAGQGRAGRDERPADELALETSSVRWTRLEVPDEPWPAQPAGRVPSCRCPTDRGCRVALVRDRRPDPPRRAVEIAAVMSNQDAINKYRADALVASEFAAFRSAGPSASTSVDPETGSRSSPSSPPWTLDVPAAGPRGPQPGRSRRWASSRPRTRAYKLMIETEVGHISSISRIPYHFFLGQPQAIPPSGESEVVGGRAFGRSGASRSSARAGRRSCACACSMGWATSAPPRPSGATPRPRTRRCARTPCSSSSRRGHRPRDRAGAAGLLARAGAPDARAARCQPAPAAVQGRPPDGAGFTTAAMPAAMAQEVP